MSADPRSPDDEVPAPPAEAPGTPRGEHDELEALQLANARRLASFWRMVERWRTFVPKAVIWIVFFGLMAALRDFFALIFATFVLCFLSTSATRALGRLVPRASWKVRSSIVFAASLVAMLVVALQLLPQAEAGVKLLNRTVRELPDRWVHEIDPWLYENVGLYRGLVDAPADAVDAAAGDAVLAEGTSTQGVDEPGPPTATAVDAPGPAADERPRRRALWEVERVRESLQEVAQHALEVAPAVLAQVVTGAGALLSLGFLSVLFAFLIVLDLQGLKAEVKRLEQTRLHGFYRETARDIVVFGSVLGKVLEAQAVISAVNTALTAAGLWWLDLPHVGFLSLLVFLCGFIPVAGVFLSSVPIGLVALAVGGPQTLVVFVLFVTGVHMLEAYVLNPRIMGARLKINPVLVLVILVIGHHALGAWGLLLGLPICYYFFTHVIKREASPIGLAARYRRLPPEQGA